ncbi:MULTISPECIES: EAL domain-containing protein [Paraburkholderia]|uniref:EAL domain-containing protein n=1 Tax=Paraburkholderia madseniana TaxID=2599607 RepID=A0AAP5ESB7_9BURK|nr:MULTISPECIES: EAL domain-containing protein [Paraburkholderia]MCX4149956.1 EAL domain-containing protein [Paraburkholderia madseniana]MDN7152892.1 EAL domain-containing protein [Paraburkholderia sp. WS6]MDQ6411774.1 EAL domain-containing protein [Paraburkholderia madseniana]
MITDLPPSPGHAPFQPPYLSFGDLMLTSAFQPIFSFSHRQSIGYEALLRARDPAGNDIPPRDIFDQTCAKGGWNNLERGVQFLHVCNFSRVAGPTDWLFLNSRPDGFIVSDSYRCRVESTLRSLQIPSERIVLEVLETPSGNLQRLVEGIASFRQQGFLIALDDFGAGHSNIDRVWQLQPDIVKLDRRVIEQAAQNPRIARSLPQLVSLLHQTGALVLIEGIETQHEALLAMESDADFAQGFYFGRPIPFGVEISQCPTVMDSLWNQFRSRAEEKEREKRRLLSVYAPALRTAAERYAAGIDIVTSCGDFLELEDASRCFVLNALGEQIGSDVTSAQSPFSQLKPFLALDGALGACWERRTYFQAAITHPGAIQATEPYLSISGAHFCVTLSIALLVHGELNVLCADVEWRPDNDSRAKMKDPPSMALQ